MIINSRQHREGLISLYEEQVGEAGSFMKVVLMEAIRKLKESKVEPSQVEDWVVRLEKDFRTI